MKIKRYNETMFTLGPEYDVLVKICNYIIDNTTIIFTKKLKKR